MVQFRSTKTLVVTRQAPEKHRGFCAAVHGASLNRRYGDAEENKTALFCKYEACPWQKHTDVCSVRTTSSQITSCSMSNRMLLDTLHVSTGRSTSCRSCATTNVEPDLELFGAVSPARTGRAVRSTGMAGGKLCCAV